MKNLATLTFAILSALSASAAVPAEWEVELSTQPPQVFSFQRPCGETIELEAVIKYHGKPFAPDITNACIFWQTNGMNNLYWSAPASVSNNIFRATWLPSMDPGATFVRGYIGDPGSIYAAAFQLRFIGSPGAVPSELPLPTKTLDFAQVTVLNPPYYDRDETDARILELAPVPGNYATVSNRAMTAVQPGEIADMETQTHAAQTYQPKGNYLTTESDPSVDGKINTHNSSTTAHSDIRTALAGKQPTIDDLATIRTGAAAGATAVQPGDDISFSREVFDPSTLSLDRYNYQIGADGIRAGRQFGGGILMLETAWFNSDSIGFGDNNAKIYFPSVHSGTLARLEDMPTDSTVSGWGYLKEEEDPTVPSWAKATTKPSYTWSEIGSKPTFATVATSGAYSDLSGKPTIPTALKCPNALTINVNGAVSATYDGSAARTVNITTGGSGPGGTVAAATLEYHADGQAIEVSVAAAGTFSATLTDWPDGQSQMAFVTLAAGASVSPAIKLIGYSEWTIGEEFMAVATRRGNKIFVNPVCITEE